MTKKVMVITEVPGMTVKQFNDSWDHVKELGHHVPNGMVHHFAGDNETGITVVDVWDSAEHWDEFKKVIGPVLAKLGVPQIEPKVMPMHYMHKIGG